MKKWLTLIAVILSVALQLQAQDSDSLLQIPSRYLDNISSKSSQLQQKLDNRSEKALQQMMKLEMKMKEKLKGLDSGKAKDVFGNAEQQYKELEQRLDNGLSFQQYISSLDSVSTSLKFLQQNPQFLSSIKTGDQKLKDALNKVTGLENQLQKAEEIKKWMRERKQYLKQQLQKIGFAKELKKLNKKIFYYGEQLNEIKTLVNDHKRAERKALGLLGKTKLFQKFFRKNSMLASLFRLPVDPDDPVNIASLAGLQTRASVTALIQNQILAGGPNARQQFSQNLQQAQSQLSALKNKMEQAGAGSSDAEVPERFTKNSQRVKSFMKKWETGINIQSNRSNGIFPGSSDVGLSAGFRPHDNFVVGVGFAGRIGWGKSIGDISVTYSGISLRSFSELKIKGSFHVSTGYEMNYRPEIRNIEQLKDKRGWQNSGLLGLSKVVSLKTKFFKQTTIKLLWDYLSYQQVPLTQPVLLRIGYNLK